MMACDASPTRSVPPMQAVDHPPVYYALFHSSIHLPQNDPPFLSKSPTPTPIYIFV